MIFRETDLPGAFVIEPERLIDGRGFFVRTYCERAFRAYGLNPCAVQCNVSFNAGCYTLRGLHYQAKPKPEDKLVRCTRGAVYDVIVDLRSESATHRKWIAVELTAENGLMLYVPRGFAHGFLTLTDGAEVFYQMSEFYEPELARGVRWNDPALKIGWPCRKPILSERDRSFPDLEP